MLRFGAYIIDCCFTDGVKELLNSYKENFDISINEPDKGVYNAMNKGIKVAKGEFLFFLIPVIFV